MYQRVRVMQFRKILIMLFALQMEKSIYYRVPYSETIGTFPLASMERRNCLHVYVCTCAYTWEEEKDG